MLCPSCGQQISESSHFCWFCGAQLAASPPALLPLNTRPPVKIGSVQFYFAGKVKLGSRRQRSKQPDLLRDGLCVDLQILDDRDHPTAYDGVADFHIKVTQAALRPPDLAATVFKTRTSVRVRVSEFQSDKEGRPFYHFECAAVLRIRVQGFEAPHSDVGISLVPEGGRQSLYRQVEVLPDPEAQTNGVLRLHARPVPILIEKPVG